jgi:hypothetical protein
MYFGRGFLRRHHKRFLTGCGLGRNHDAIRHARARRQSAVIIQHGYVVAVGFKPLHRVQADPDSYGDKRAESAMDPCPERDPFLFGFGLPGCRQ